MKVCNDFELGQKINTDSKMLAGECKKAQAFLVGQDKTTCGTSFDQPTVHSLTKEGEPFNNGYVITYTKENNVNSIRIIALCQDDKAPATQGAANLVKDQTLSNAHSSVFVFTGKEACKVADLSAMQGFKKFVGIFKIAIGVALVFVGSKFILLVIGFLVFVIFSTVPFVMLYNVGIIGDPLTPGQKGKFIGFSVGCTLLGAVASYFLTKVAKNYTTLLMGFCAGCAVTFILITPVNIDSKIKTVLIFVCGGLGAYIGRSFDKYIKSAGTAIIGSVVLMNGVGSYVGGFPDLFSSSVKVPESGVEQQKFWGYVVGMILFAVSGTFVQLKYVTEDIHGADDDDFTNKNNA
jgi:hypothetical protein